MNKYTTGFFSLLLIFIIGCSLEGPRPDKAQGPNPYQIPGLITGEMVSIVLTDNSESVEEEGRVWKLSAAELINESGTINVSSLPNIEDDEFLFKTGDSENEIILTWRPRNDIDFEATTSEEAKKDYYLSVETYTGIIDEDNPTLLEFADGKIQVEIISEDEIEIQIGNFESKSQVSAITTKSHYLELCNSCSLLGSATPKTEADYKTVPSELTFTKLLDVQYGNNFFTGAPGFTASEAENKLYWSYRQDGGDRLEHVLSYNLATQEVEDCSTGLRDFVSKQIHVSSNGVSVVGGQRINIYPKDLNPTNAAEGEATCNPDAYDHGLWLSRFGSAIMEGDLYIFGGDLNEINSDKIYRWDDTNNVLEMVGRLPSPKSWANGDIVDGKLYVFGGQAQFSGTPSEDTIYIFDFDTNSTETLSLPVPLYRSYVARDENLIYVAGQLDNENYDIFFGVFNTIDNSFTQVPLSLTSEGNRTIHQMTILDNKVYVIYGGRDENGNPVDFGIYAAEI
ncbi:Kelch repeat-containing protein [Christiangramia crocea]|uniref:Uncharacterized protein n=1 Tax=Christiangramia crocea TaxID=2904124 RepID=A0A9X1UW63_9FLAO|nr:hypothetical protein [Gramella crocea]MCG9970579.1 hypothetical protein [Gramella crocea]